MLADAVDHEEERTGHRREALFFSMQGVCQKTMLGIAAVTFPFLIYFGSDNTATATGVKLVGLASAAACLVAFVIFLRYPLRERDGKVVLKGS
jgi:GPH family glycoside/pentoside/hexuronide:cation symporter